MERNSKNITIGIMQGRLSPRYKNRYQAFPVEFWKDEFFTAQKLGFDCIEWIFDYENVENNPIFDEKRIKKIEEMIDITGVKVYSICADYFMMHPIHSISEQSQNIEIINQLCYCSSCLGVKDITIPCVDNSSIRNSEDKENVIKFFEKCLPIAQKYGINLNLESDLPPKEIYEIMALCKHKHLKVNYDMGNSASLGFDSEEEIEVYGKYISVVHVKDRKYKSGSVKLGTGDTNFCKVLKKLKQINFNGLFIMQAARAENFEKEIILVKEQFSFFKDCLARWFVS